MPRVPTKPLPEVEAAPIRPVFQNVPAATPEAFGAGAARGLSQVGKALIAHGEQLAEAEERIQSRRATLDRLKRKETVSNELFKAYNNVVNEQDITDPDILQAAGDNLGTIAQRSTDAHRVTGVSEENALQYEVEVQDLVSKYRDELSGKSISIAKEKSQTAQSQAINVGSKEASDFPERALTIMQDGGAKALMSLGGLMDSGEETAFVAKWQATVAQSAINSWFARGDAESVTQAMTFIGHPAVVKAVGAEAMRKITTRSSKLKNPPRVWDVEETSKKFRLSAQEAQNVIVVETANGIEVKMKPPQSEEIVQIQIAEMVKDGTDPQRAEDLARGWITLHVSDETGEVVETNSRTKEVTVRKKIMAGVLDEDRKRPKPKRGIYNDIMQNPVSGIGPFTMEAFFDISGQIPGVDIPEYAAKSIAARQNLLNAQTTMLSAFRLDVRLSKPIIDWIMNKTNIATSLFKSDKALLIRVVAVDSWLKARIGTEQAIANDANVGIKRREIAETLVINMQNFRTELGVPDGADALAPEPAPVQILGDREFNKLEPGTQFIGPDGKLRQKPF